MTYTESKLPRLLATILLTVTLARAGGRDQPQREHGEV